MISSLLAANANQQPLGFIEGPGGFSPADEAEAANSIGQFTTFFSNMLALLTIVAGLAFILYFIFGAINWITSSGDQNKAEAARNQLTAAGIGLVVVVASYTIIAVAGDVLGLDILLQDPGAIEQSLDPSQ